ncbi:hypothetical protein U27_02142 [Candidatus Vecturithrix granuli]|uniref:Apple domain-containing protein n=1 Tax=Vecturithrix granuli TaxID=1499967 RepID=A0A0S6WC51_VECG1|nr:hypothetical protein U27_02142 [Candidatus Vecturithrix granuli]
MWMRVLIRLLLLGGIVSELFTGNIGAEQAPAPTQSMSKCADTVPQNFEIRIQHLTHIELPAWTGQIFALADGKPVGTVSLKKPCQQLAVGNYVLILHFQETLPEIESLRPFTFSISRNNKTIFTLQIGKAETSEIEYGVGRTGADFVDSDPRRGRDYVNFELPKNQPELCFAKCKKDPNCDAYSYGNPPEWPMARCWLMHGFAVPHPDPHAVSGVIQREDAPPYRVEIITHKLDPEK